MNRAALKKYAPQARLDFIEAVTLRARRLGLDPALSVSIEQTGDVLLIGGQPFPATIGKQRATLAGRIQQQGFSTVVEALAYTWFNRLVAIRFMELKGYLSHGYRVLSHPQDQQPEILDNVQHLDLFGLDKVEVIRLKTAGNQDEILYREILLAQCHELHRNMPFLFEALDDATELLLPDNLLRTDSPIARLVGDVEEGDWQEVEIIGWLYQFYISEKKDEVIGKVVKSEDIPAATQLFTPNWIVQYLVQNSLGRLWLMANPSSSLKDKMPYYVEPAEQTPEVQAQLDALIKVRMDEDGGTLNPESLSVLDPACGSGHILVEAYNLLRAIYEERGYRLRDIPRLILKKNLFGLDIDDRAAQLAGFALLMKAREDDRRLFDDEGNPPHLNIMAIQQSAGLPDEEMAKVIIDAAIQTEGGEAFDSGQLFGGGQLETQHSSGLTVLDLRQLIQLFEHGKTFGSLISVPDALKVKLGKIVDLLVSVRGQGDDLSRSYAGQVLEQFAWPASLLALQYDAVVANPPYMGSQYFCPSLSKFVQSSFSSGKSDLYGAFIVRNLEYIKEAGSVGMITMQNWMFLSGFAELRRNLFEKSTIESLLHNGRGVWGSDFGSCAFVVRKKGGFDYSGSYYRLFDKDRSVSTVDELDARFKCETPYVVSVSDFKVIPGYPVSYWTNHSVREIFKKNPQLASISPPRTGMTTGDDGRFLRIWHEVDRSLVGLDLESAELAESSDFKWFPYNKGGSYQKWFGNNLNFVNWRDDGAEIKKWVVSNPKDPKTTSWSRRIFNHDYFFKECITYTLLSGSGFCVRYIECGAISNVNGPAVFGLGSLRFYMIALMNSVVGFYLLKAINPTLAFNPGDVGKLPVILIKDKGRLEEIDKVVLEVIDIYKSSWNSSEYSWGFSELRMLGGGEEQKTLKKVWLDYSLELVRDFDRALYLEGELNKTFIELYGLHADLSHEVPEDQVSLVSADREKDSQRLISYSIGCIMGRYSLDEPGLIYANNGNIGFDSSRYTKLPADADGILPITEESWFEDDAAERVNEFVKVVWGNDTLVENMEWLADSLNRKAGEAADETIRRYLSTSFYKDHLQTYKKRPIYWLFSSGKQKAFECLVYLHRYNEGTLARMRMEYVVPLQSRMQARIDKLADDITNATGSAQQKALQKRKDKLAKQLEELRRFDEALRTYADQRITLDLDDGVKVNYGKFGDLLAEVKAITGGKED